jgi:hypothetical protein
MSNAPKIFKSLLDKKGNQNYHIAWSDKTSKDIAEYFAMYHFQNDIKVRKFSNGGFLVKIIKQPLNIK